MRTIKPATLDDVMSVQRAIELLKEARDLLKAAGADNTTDKVRAAIISAGGAERHVCHRYSRATGSTAGVDATRTPDVRVQ